MMEEDNLKSGQAATMWLHEKRCGQKYGIVASISKDKLWILEVCNTCGVTLAKHDRRKSKLSYPDPRPEEDEGFDE